MHARTSASSIDLMTTSAADPVPAVFNDHLRVGDRPLRLSAGIEIGRSATFEPVRVSTRNVVLIELFGTVNDGFRRPQALGEVPQQEPDRVAPGLEMELLEDPLDGLLGRLVRGERGPFVVAHLARV